MMRNAIRFHMLAACLLFLTGGGFCQYKAHILHPWAADTARANKPVHIISPAAGPPPPGTAMTAEGNNWHTYTFGGAKPAANFEFYFASYIPTQNQTTANPAFYYGSPTFNFGSVFFSRGVDEVWIIPQGPDKPAVISIYPLAKKVAMFFNPWPESAPMARTGDNTAYSNMLMSPDPARCGWYGTYFQAEPYTAHYKAVFGSETYGMGGLNDAKVIDLTAAFANHDTVFLVPTPYPGGAPEILFSFPVGMTGQCAFPLAVTVRDFSKNHPAFERDVRSDGAFPGMVGATLDAENKPVMGTRPHTYQAGFDKWFRDDSTNADPNLRNYTTCRDLPMSKATGGLWGHDAYVASPSKGYFPIDDFNRFNEVYASQYIDRISGGVKNDPTAKPHNFHFCMEMHATFKYQPGQRFRFMGDDDTWAFINKKLVMDLGGPHPSVEARVNLDTIKPALTPGQDYPFDFFICERQTSGSNLLLETSIFFVQQQSIFVKREILVEGGIKYGIWERISGDKSCNAKQGDKENPAQSEFKLSGPSVNPPELLKAGLSYGGIKIDPAMISVTVDTNAIAGLRPGVYTITYTSLATGKGGVIRFTVPGVNTLEFSDKRVVNEVVGTAVALTIQAMASGQPDRRVEAFRLNSNSPDLKFYRDSSLTQPITGTTDLSTDSTTGSRRVWITSPTPGTYQANLLGGAGFSGVVDDFRNIAFYKQLQVTVPVADPPGQGFVLPFSVTLTTSTAGATILYTLDGTPPDTVVGGSTLVYTVPIRIDKYTVLKARAVKPALIPSDIITENYLYTPPLKTLQAWYQDLDGDGRIETANLDFSGELPAAPDRLEFIITAQTGLTHSLTALKSNREIAISAAVKSRSVITFSTPFPFGMTSVANRDVSGKIFLQKDIPVLGATFPVNDSVAPVIVKAEVFEPDSLRPLKRVSLAYSENVQFPLNSQEALVFKREGREFPAGRINVNRIEKVDDRHYVVYVDSLSDIFPIVGDSVAINTNGQTADGLANAPARKLFRVLEGIVPKPKPMDIYVTFPAGDVKNASWGNESSLPGVVFIPVDSRGLGLAGGEPGKCPGCLGMVDKVAVGPVLHIVTPGPVDYEFKIYSTLGDFLVMGKGSIVEADLPALAKKNDASGIKYDVRIVWTGLTARGTKAGTGAYILTVAAKSSRDLKTGAAGAVENRKIIFGMLRSFRGS